MAAVAVARRVGVVLEQVDGAADAFVAQPLLGARDKAFEYALPCTVVHDALEDGVALWRRVLGV